MASTSRIQPNPALWAIKIPDSTPEIVTRYALGDEQALLAKVRYNRLVDIFLSVTAYPLQSHLRTTVRDVGQIEIDELYVAVDSSGTQFVVPVQAKGGTDQIGVVQTAQDLLFCAERFPALVARAVAAQFASNDVIAMFELLAEDGEVRVKREHHYSLVPSADITDEDLETYRR